MPAPAGGFFDCTECSVAQSLVSLRPMAESAVAERSGWHSTRWSSAPGTVIAAWFAHGPGGAFGAAAAGCRPTTSNSGTSGTSSNRERADMELSPSGKRRPSALGTSHYPESDDHH